MGTSKFERVLSDEEMAVVINDGCTDDLFSLAERVEQAVLAKLAEQKPVAWIAAEKLMGMHSDVRFNRVNWQVTLRVSQVEDDEIPLYARPTPSSQGLLDSSNHFADASKVDDQEHQQ